MKLWRTFVEVIALTFALSVNYANAICITPPNEELGRLTKLSATNPNLALNEVQTMLVQAEKNKSPPRDIAWLYAIKSDAYWQLSDSPNGEKASRAGLDQDISKADPVYAQLLIQYVFRDFKTETFRQSIPILTAARPAFKPGSDADICLQATLGDVQRLAGDFTPAAANLINAYRRAQGNEHERQRMYTAYALALFMRAAGDYPRALELLAETREWDERMGHSFKIGGKRYVAARMLRLSGRYDEALNEINQALTLAKITNDKLGHLYYGLEKCSTLTRLHRLKEATLICQKSVDGFKIEDPDMVGEAQSMLADIALQQNQPKRSLELLNGALKSSSANTTLFNGGNAYRLRAEAHATLGEYEQAYRDLLKHIQFITQKSENEAARLTIARSAELEADRQNANNRILKRDLEESRVQARVQNERTIGLVIVGVVIIGLLSSMAIMAKRNRKLLEHSANIDPLTGLYNRRKILEISEELLATAQNRDEPIAVTIADIDHFKVVNDTYGHPVGDEVLRQFASILQSTLRETDIIGRWGGEEFIMLMPNLDKKMAASVIERVRDRTAKLLLSQAPELKLTFSAGISDFTDTADHIDIIVSQADVALYAAKHAGRSQTQCWTSQMDTSGDIKSSVRSIA